MKYLVLMWVLHISGYDKCNAQVLGLDRLFSPGLTCQSELIAPATYIDSSKFSYNQHSLSVVIPLKTKLDATLKEIANLTAKTSQTFLTVRGKLNKASIEDLEYPLSPVYGLQLGYTRLSASLSNGVWIQSATFSISENSTSFPSAMVLNGRAYAAKLKIKNTKMIYIYGAALIYNQKQFIPVPVFGLMTRVAKRLWFSSIIPIQAKIEYRIRGNQKISLAASYDGLNPIDRQELYTVNYNRVKTFLGFSTSLGTHFKLTSELGYTVMNKIVVKESNLENPIMASPYASFAINYRFGKSLFRNFIENT